MTGEVSSASEKRHWVRLTLACNQRCLFCHDRNAQTGKSLSFGSVKADLARGRKGGLRRVVLSGGEPSLHPRFIDIVRLARKLGYEHIQAVTNGRRFCYPGFLKAAVGAGLDEATFSLHGHTRELHERLTRVPGSFVQSVAALRAALAIPGLIVSVDVVINGLNLPALRELLEFYVGMGVREFDLLALVPFGDAWENQEELDCDFSRPENLSRLHRALELSRRPGLHIFTNRLRPEFLEGFESLIQPPEKILDEVRGRWGLFDRWLKGGPPPSCAGEACPRCFLRDFCRDLGLLLREGSLPAKAGLLCRGAVQAGGRPIPINHRKGQSRKAGRASRSPSGKASAGGGAKPPEKPFRFGRKKDIAAYAEFFIRARYFVKSSACGRCAWAGRCAGMGIREVREKGFGIVRPVGGRRLEGPRG